MVRGLADDGVALLVGEEIAVDVGPLSDVRVRGATVTVVAGDAEVAGAADEEPPVGIVGGVVDGVVALFGEQPVKVTRATRATADATRLTTNSSSRPKNGAERH